MSRTPVAASCLLGLLASIQVIPQDPSSTTPAQVPVVVARENIDAEMNAKIRAEGIDRSKIMWIEHYLTDVYGPRPTGSPNHVAAANWALKTMAAWGMKNTHLEPFTWRGVGWLPGRASGFITSPVKASLRFEAIPWSPSTQGTIAGEIMQIVPPQNPTETELTALLTDFAPRMKGAIVMVGAVPNAPVNFNEPRKRLPDDEVKASYSRRIRMRGAAAGGAGARSRRKADSRRNR